MADIRFSLIEISYKNGEVETYGCLFVNGDGKLEFEGDVEESARVFFEDCLKPRIENYIKLLINKRKYPLFYWRETL